MVKQAGAEAHFMKSDVSKLAEVEALVAKIIATWGRMDCAFNNAGIDGKMARLAECTEETWNRTIAVNLTGVFFCMKAEIPHMLRQGGGAIVNTALSRRAYRIAGAAGLRREQARRGRIDTRGGNRVRARKNPGQLRMPGANPHADARALVRATAPRWNSASPRPSRSSAWASRPKSARRSRGSARMRPPTLPAMRCQSTGDTWRSERGRRSRLSRPSKHSIFGHAFAFTL